MSGMASATAATFSTSSAMIVVVLLIAITFICRHWVGLARFGLLKTEFRLVSAIRNGALHFFMSDMSQHQDKSCNNKPVAASETATSTASSTSPHIIDSVFNSVSETVRFITWQRTRTVRARIDIVNFANTGWFWTIDTVWRLITRIVIM